MKILAIRGRNLASLAGEFELNLATSPLKDEGLYAITGPTGAGKSTLLDAICLALYGKMPRLPNRHGVTIADGEHAIKTHDPRTILRRGTASGFAEVDFLANDGKHYRSRWSVRRARHRPDGKLQAATLSLQALPEQRILAGNITEHRARIESLLGLNFAQFRRSVLLAQGDFAAFIHASPSERAELLERMTGTEIYTHLSRAAHERSRKEKQQLQALEEQLAGLSILNREQRQDLERQIQSWQQQTDEAMTQVSLLKQALEWHEQLIRLEAALENAKEEYARLQQHAQTLASHRETLEARRRIAALSSDYQAWLHSQQLCDSLQLEITKKRTTHEQLTQQLRKLQKRLTQARTAHENAEREWEQAQPKLQTARRLDEQVQSEAQHLEQLNSQYQQRQYALEGLREQARIQNQLLTTHQQQQRQAQQWLEQHHSGQTLAEQWPRWKDMLQRLIELHTTLATQQEKQAQLQTRQTTLMQQAQQLESQQKQLTEERKRLQAQQLELTRKRCVLPSLETLSKKQKQLLVWQEQLQQAQQLAQRWQEAHAQIQTLEHSLKRLQTQQTTVRKRQTAAHRQWLERKAALKEARQTLQRLQVRTDQLVEHLRAQLEPDQPCPVCGSHEHPWRHAISKAFQEELETQRQSVHELEQDVERLHDENARSKAALVHLENQYREYSTQCQALQEQSDECAKNWAAMDFSQKPTYSIDDPHLYPALNALFQELATQQNKLSEQLHQWETLQENEQYLQREQHALQLAEQENNEKRRTIRERQQTENIQEKQCEESIQSTRSQIDEIVSMLQAPLTHFDDWQTHLDTQAARFINTLEQWVQTWQANQQCIEQARKSQAHIQPQLAKIQGQIQAEQARLDELQREIEHTKQHLEQQENQRQAIFDGQAVTVIEQRLKRAYKQSQHDLAHIQKETSTQEIEVVALSNQLKTLKQQLHEQHQRHQALETQLKQYIQAQDMDWERMEALLNLSEEQIEHMEKSLQKLEHDRVRCQALQDERRKQLERHRHQAPQLAIHSPQILQERLEQAQQSLADKQTQLQALRFSLQQDDERQKHARELKQAYQEQQNSWQHWAALDELIGSSDGQKFRNFAQSLTLQHLVEHANEHLQRLSRRYFLQCVPNAQMELQVVDRDLGNEVRNIYGLSGGETFLVSLALALGLASLSAHRVQVESLLIDEGFGTLDAETLGMAIEALDALQAQGRQVGIITHVSALVDCVRTKVRLRPKSGGRSALQVESA